MWLWNREMDANPLFWIETFIRGNATSGLLIASLYRYWAVKRVHILVFSLACDSGQVGITIHRIYGANPVDEKMEIYRGFQSSGEKIHTETGRNSAYLESVIDLCILPTSHTIILSDS